MRRPHPRSTLFPYTTLFRSVAEQPLGAGEPAVGDRPVAVELPVHPEEDPRDRKSTRLNSSHSSISYAVFCLKKKEQRLPRRRCTSTCLSLSARPATDGPRAT